MTDAILYRYDRHVAWITLNRPEAMNALNREMLDGLIEVFHRIRDDSDVYVVVVTGAGDRAFSAGADIRFLSSASPLEVRELAHLAVEAGLTIENCGKTVIAAINGYALGGGLEIAEACTLRIAAEHAMFGHPEVRIGAVAGWGGTSRLPRLIGQGKALELLLTGRLINARDALAEGLVNALVPAEKLVSEAERLAKEISEQAPQAVRFTLEAANRGLEMSLEESLKTGADYFGLVAETEDFREGTHAFLEKRKPSFRNK